MLILLLFNNPILFLMVAVAILFALSWHEFFHAWMAYYLGDPTAKDQGRLTVNPLAHLDPFGTLLLFFVGIGWGKPVPFNPYNLRNQKWGPALVSLAGPASNLIVAILVGISLRFIDPTNMALNFFLGFFVWINLILGFFNLMPIPPLDGSHLFATLFPSYGEKMEAVSVNNPLFIIGVVMFMVFVVIPYILEPLFHLITGSPLAFF